jgi:hypothetical protein
MPEYDYEQLKRDAEPFIRFEKDVKNRIAYITFDRLPTHRTPPLSVCARTTPT